MTSFTEDSITWKYSPVSSSVAGRLTSQGRTSTMTDAKTRTSASNPMPMRIGQ